MSYEFDAFPSTVNVISGKGGVVQSISSCGGRLNSGQHAFLINSSRFLLNPHWGRFEEGGREENNWKDSRLVVLRRERCIGLASPPLWAAARDTTVKTR